MNRIGFKNLAKPFAVASQDILSEILDSTTPVDHKQIIVTTNNFKLVMQDQQWEKVTEFFSSKVDSRMGQIY